MMVHFASQNTHREAEGPVVVGWIDRLCAALASRGVVKIERDDDWEMRQEPTTVRGEKPLNPFQEMDYHFYPMMLRWTFADGRRRLAWLPPEIDTSGARPRLDWPPMERRFVDLILLEATPTPSQAQDGYGAAPAAEWTIGTTAKDNPND